jgi:hypothetical protein
MRNPLSSPGPKEEGGGKTFSGQQSAELRFSFRYVFCVTVASWMRLFLEQQRAINGDQLSGRPCRSSLEATSDAECGSRHYAQMIAP